MDAYRLAGLTVLIVEDEMFIATAIREYFLQAGADAAEMCATLAQAEDLVAEMAFDVALLDVTLPDGDVGGLAQTLESKGTKLVFHSGRPLPDDLRVLFPDAGFAMKPSDPNDLIAIVASVSSAE